MIKKKIWPISDSKIADMESNPYRLFYCFLDPEAYSGVFLLFLKQTISDVKMENAKKKLQDNVIVL